VGLLEELLICHPMAANWDAYIGGRYVNQIMSYLALEIMGLFLDLIILEYPLVLMWTLPMPLRQKVKPMVPFSSGIMQVRSPAF
jgi:hypothetical protein